MTRSILADAFAHHVWATLQVLDTCDRLTPDDLAVTAPGTYGSIIDTLRHLVAADAGYLFALTGGRVATIAATAMTVGELRAVMERHGAAWADLVVQDLDPDEMVVRRRGDGSEGHAPRGIRVAQALHHGSDHRSQVCTILSTVGTEPPAIDVWDYAATLGLLGEVPPPGG